MEYAWLWKRTRERIAKEEGLGGRLFTNTATLELTVNRPSGNYITMRAVPNG